MADTAARLEAVFVAGQVVGTPVAALRKLRLSDGVSAALAPAASLPRLDPSTRAEGPSSLGLAAAHMCIV